MELNAYNNQLPLEKETSLVDYWRVLWRRRWTLGAFALLVFVSTALFTFLARPKYTAKGTLLIEKEPNILTFEEIFQIETFRDDYYQTQYKLLQSRSLAERAVDKLQLVEKAAREAGARARGKKIPDPASPEFRRGVVNSFLGAVKVSPLRMTRLVEVSFTHHDPRFAAAAVNALFDSFIDLNIETKYQATEQASAFLNEQIASLRQEIEKKETDLQKYGQEKNIVLLSDKETTIVDKLAELNRALTEAQIDRVKKETYYQEVRGATPDNIPDSLSTPLIQKLREEYVGLSRQYSRMADTFKPDYPEMQRLKVELDTARQLLEEEVKNLIKQAYSEYQAALKKERSLHEIFNLQKQEAFQLNSNAILYNSLKIEIENMKGLLESLIKRQSEMGVAARQRGLRTANVRIVDRAQEPLAPSSPRKMLNLILGLILGLFGGAGLAFFFEYLDNSVKTSEDVEKYGRMPCLGVVPEFDPDKFSGGYGYGYGYGYGRKRKKKKEGEKEVKAAEAASLQVKGKKKRKGEEERRLGGTTAFHSAAANISGQKGGLRGDEEVNPEKVMGVAGDEAKAEAEKTFKPRSIEFIPHLAPKSNFAECYRAIRTALLLSSADPNLKAVAISSPLPEDGKTATLVNLAIVLAQAGKKVLAVDADFRKPRLHRIFGVKNLGGLTNYLTGGVELKELVKTTSLPNLFLINAGPVPPNPAELLSSGRMAELVKQLRSYFDYILFDTPPLLAVADAAALGSMIDGMILIVWGGRTSRETLAKARDLIDLVKIKPLGGIINHLNRREYHYYYKPGYSYYYYYE